MNQHLMEKFFALALILTCGLTASAQEQSAARQNSRDAIVVPLVAQPASSREVQSSDLPLMGTLAGASSLRHAQPQQSGAVTRAESPAGAPPQAMPAPAQTPAPTPLPVVAPTPLPNLAPTTQPAPAMQPAPDAMRPAPDVTPLPRPQLPGATPSAGEAQAVSPQPPTPTVLQPQQQVVTPSNASAESSLAVPPVASDYRATLGATLPVLERVGVNMAEQRPLALREAIELALQNGKDIEVARTNVRAAEFDLTAARGAYDPRLNTSTFTNETKRPSRVS